MQNLAHQRCFNHAGREAVARCPECGHCFCRECITEHDDRVVCAACLKNLTARPPVRRTTLVRLLGLAQCAFGILIAWFFFFLIGAGLLKLPASFHEGTLWQVPWVDHE
jgi:hypothetical protein